MVFQIKVFLKFLYFPKKGLGEKKKTKENDTHIFSSTRPILFLSSHSLPGRLTWMVGNALGRDDIYTETKSKSLIPV